MNEVFDKTRQLGEALLQSEEYKKVKAAEQKAMANEDAARAVGRFLELRGQMEEIMRASEKDWAKVQSISDEMNECRRFMDENEDLCALDKAREEFSELINQINGVLRFIVTGEMDDRDGCSGDCSGCGGCVGKVN